MKAGGYWVELYQDRQRLGGGFLVTRRFVLTALHCLRGLNTVEEDLTIVLADGTRLGGQVRRRDKDADLALIEIDPGRHVSQPVPAAGVASAGMYWRGPYKPAQNDVELTGQVDSAGVSYLCEGGALIDALQLTADQLLGDYSGYSGGPVEASGHGRGPVVAGILLEQVPDRVDAGRNTNVLFAATLKEAMQRFDHFDVLHLIDVLRPEPAQPNTPMPLEPVQVTSARRPSDRVESVIQAFQQLADQNVLDPGHIAELRYLALQEVFKNDPGAGRHE
ncbi:S1 family peptidase [Streptomyces phaeochromogenes]|uniref:S1 family peptidase n=1 Tax=Streptomyces phaeochromogenes TaxID=1923 RepID=UPI002E0FFAFB|nr:serine protease [Streptomyces phaeochromogenes]